MCVCACVCVCYSVPINLSIFIYIYIYIYIWGGKVYPLPFFSLTNCPHNSFSYLRSVAGALHISTIPQQWGKIPSYPPIKCVLRIRFQTVLPLLPSPL